MNKIFLVAITVGVLLIAGIVSYNFIQQQIQVQEYRQILADSEKRALLQDEHDKKFDGYFNDTRKCGNDKPCWDKAWHDNGLDDPKFEVFN